MQKIFIFICVFFYVNQVGGQMKVIAHKGASMEAPENTLVAFQKAIHLGADFIECDIRLTKDKVPVVIHDETIQQKPVHQLTLDEVLKWDAGSWFLRKFSGVKVPTLEELLKLNFGKTGLMIEIKEMESLADLKYIYDVIKKYNTNKLYYVGSFFPAILEHLQKLDPDLPLIGIARSEQDLESHLKLQPKVLALRHQLLSSKLIIELHHQNIEVWCWTIDDPSFHVTGLDGIITNNVARFLQTKTPESGDR